MKTACLAIYSVLNKVSNAANKALGLLAGVLIALCAAALLFQVLYRFVIVKFFSFSFPFTEEFARYALIWSAYLCLGINLKDGSQSAVNFLYDRLQGTAKLLLYCLTRFFVAVFLVVALYYGLIIVDNNSIFKSATLRIPGLYLYSAPVVGCLLMLYEMVNELFGVLSGALKPFGAGAWESEDNVPDVDLSSLLASDGADATEKK